MDKGLYKYTLLHYEIKSIIDTLIAILGPENIFTKINFT
jgi:hypothetical protein